MFHADNEEQWIQIKNTIDMSDYYILIVGRYCGTLIEEEGISYTEKEYNYALSKGIPVLSFVISDDAKKNNRNGWIKNNIDNIFDVLNNSFGLLEDNKIDELFRKLMYAKLLNCKTEASDIMASTNNFIESQLKLLRLQNASMDFYIKDLTKIITINLLDEYIEIDTLTQYIFYGIPDKDNFSFFPWLFPGIEQNTYDFITVKYNAATDSEYIKRGTFKPTPNESYVSGGIGIEIPYDKDKIEHNITFRTKYCTEYARFFHSYSFKKICEHFNLSASLYDYRKEAKDAYALKWEMFTPYRDYSFNSKNKISQTDSEIKFSPINWIIPGCGYIITLNHIK